MNKRLNDRVFYEIYPPSFFDSNADGIGDIPGIIEKLDYISQMGFNGIWLNPCFKSPFFDGGYDVEDYYTVAPRYGTNADLKKLFVEAHKRDILVLLDLVPCHTAVTCQWFKESMKAEHNAYTGRYLWTDSIETVFTDVKEVTGTLRGISERNGNCAVSYFSTQPALNYGYAECIHEWQHGVDSPDARATQEELMQIMRFWLSMGCDGFRVDMAAFLVKNDREHSGTIALWKKILGEVRKEFPQAIFVSEWSEPEKAIAAGFDMDFVLGPMYSQELWRTEKSFFSSNAEGNLGLFWEKYIDQSAKIKNSGVMCFSSGNHDNTRYAKTTDEIQRKLVMAFLMSMPGVPFVYYGDEIAMRYLKCLKSVDGGYHRTGSRTPMQWDTSTNCGFSAAAKDKLYLPIDPSEDRPTVEQQMQQENSLLHHTQCLLRLRKEHPALQAEADFKLLTEKESYPLAYLRSSAEEQVLVVINPAEKCYKISIPNEIGRLGQIFSCGGNIQKEGDQLSISPCSAAIYSVLA